MYLTHNVSGIKVHLRGGEGDTGLVHNAGTDVPTAREREERRGEEGETQKLI